MQQFLNSIENFKRFLSFLKRRRLLWLTPLVVFLVLISGLFILATVSSTFAPFIYALF